MEARNLILVLAIVGLAIVASPAIGTASADVCRVGDVECHERKARCHAATLTDPMDPRLCTA